ncbi:hypothetical protein ANCDUO_23320 [Ancylostoma duodenale]|uniref:Tc1-like transposase DDE domain-containing protein n=1 Tax=Ancylostoma duodenale TaxID=51022 RepID=A0A0C2FP35_9BILA|nr:hypothetical protein ANCDUO_23320 [Ancylostoma duodenale]
MNSYTNKLCKNWSRGAYVSARPDNFRFSGVLLEVAGRHRKILFSDEKWFDGERADNHQNDRMWLKGKPPLEQRMVTRRQKPKQLMVWAGLTYTDKTPLIIVHEGVKVEGPHYFAILENKVLPWALRYFGEEMWRYQHDGAPSHKSKETYEWIARNFPGFTSVALCP